MEFDIHITETLLRRIALRRIVRRLPLILLAFVLILTGTLLEIRDGRLGGISIAGLTAMGFLFILYAAVYIRQIRAIAEWKRQQGNDPVHYTLGEETIKASSNLGSSELKWTVFRELREHRDFILLGMGRSGHLTLPLAEVPPEALAFIREKFASMGRPTKRA